MKTILVTGAAGFIGAHLTQRLTGAGIRVVGLDNLNDYYDPQLKRDRMAALAEGELFVHEDLDIADRPGMQQLFERYRFDVVVNLAAQAGVRYSLINPHSYVDTNLVGFVNILEGCRHGGVKHFVYASSSSVYGAHTRMPFSVHDNVDHPVSLYAASKKANELMAHTYSHLYNLPTTGLRFFTVYGPWGRPDMALFLFTKAILAGEPIDVFNYGNMERDFTYVDDIVEGVVRVIASVPSADPEWSGDSPDPATSYCPYRVYNIGNNNKEKLLRYIEVLEDCLGRKAEKNLLPMQPGDVPATFADVDDLVRDFDYRPATSLEYGIEKFVQWYREYFRV
ncbi:NAD-dependent epimerase [Desulfofustis glycolicus]|uniref:UDP-glucuronate 4-epimerase n=1 Tax=Desulfofustis glycolicus DSM 9705 TaxID=1121409 RepID=A0A1M5W6R8_9BACT|nr:NAD-dependent epimerase [Desulfofustis glycolicus]MCB2217271.1 NAD-dependent epimerase [Desulfobulbaceae bacterium]SHH82883.1 UDP-glucuronate 4-epimerase [Desulfofustis glycolicus DSM 9705]